MAESENWQFEKSALECHKYMLDNSIATDVTFVVSKKMFGMNEQRIHSGNEATTFKAHKYQMIARSPVFYPMLCGDLAEKGNIIVDDIDPGAFKEMLNYIYTDTVDIKPELAMPLLYASKKYLLPGLTKVCVNYLEESLSGDNACILYDHSLLFDEDELSERSLLLIKNKTKECMKAPSLTFVRQSTLSNILDSERFTTPEIDVYSACERWAKHQVEQTDQEITGEAMRSVLGDCVFKIRYPVLKFEEFGTIVAPAGILLVDDEIAMFRYFASRNKIPLPDKFQSKNRFLSGSPFTISYDGSRSRMPVHSEIKTKFDIISDQTISLKCFIIGGFSSNSGRKTSLTCSQLYLDGEAQQVQSIQTGSPSTLYPGNAMTIYKNRKMTVDISLKFSSIYSAEEGNIECSNSREICISNETTGINVSVSSNNDMCLLGFLYDYNYI